MGADKDTFMVVDCRLWIVESLTHLALIKLKYSAMPCTLQSSQTCILNNVNV